MCVKCNCSFSLIYFVSRGEGIVAFVLCNSISQMVEYCVLSSVSCEVYNGFHMCLIITLGLLVILHTQGVHLLLILLMMKIMEYNGRRIIFVIIPGYNYISMASPNAV